MVVAAIQSAGHSFLPSHSNSLLFSDGVSRSSKSKSPLSSKSSDKMEPSLRSSVRLKLGAISFFFFLLPLISSGLGTAKDNRK